MKGKYKLWSSLIVWLLASTVFVSTGITPSLPKVSAPAIKDSTKIPGSTFTVNVMVTEFTNLYGWGFFLYFDPSVLQVLPLPGSVQNGDFFTDPETCWFKRKMDNTMGYVTAAAFFDAQYYPDYGLDGSGTLATITFKVLKVGVTVLDLTETKLNTVILGNNVPIEHLAEDGVFDNREANMPPVASFTPTPPIGVEGEIITFDASASSDDGWIISYFWDFGDGTNATGKIVQHIWGAGYAGVYTVRLTVTDNDGVTSSSQYTVAILPWMQAGNHPDLIRTLIWPEQPVFKEADFGEHEILWAKVGNPTTKTYKVRVDFEIFSKDEGRKLGTISTAEETILPNEVKDMQADFFLGNYKWATTTGPWNWPTWVKKYWAIGRCFYLNETTGQWEAGIFPGANQFKIHPVVHDRAIIAMSANYNLTHPADVGDTVVISVTLENQGQQIEHDIQLTVGVYGVCPIGTATITTLPVGEKQTLTFNWVVPSSIQPGNQLIIAKTPQTPEPYSHPYETDSADNWMDIPIAFA